MPPTKSSGERVSVCSWRASAVTSRLRSACSQDCASGSSRQRGSAVLVRGSDELKSRVDIWGPIGDGLAVMRAIKRQFDPNGILNPGRGAFL